MLQQWKSGNWHSQEALEHCMLHKLLKQSVHCWPYSEPGRRFAVCRNVDTSPHQLSIADESSSISSLPSRRLTSCPLALNPAGLSILGAKLSFLLCPLGRSVRLGARGRIFPRARPPMTGISYMAERAAYSTRSYRRMRAHGPRVNRARTNWTFA